MICLGLKFSQRVKDTHTFPVGFFLIGENLGIHKVGIGDFTGPELGQWMILGILGGIKLFKNTIDLLNKNFWLLDSQKIYFVKIIFLVDSPFLMVLN